MSLSDLFRNLEVLDPTTHGALRYSPAERFDFARHLKTAPLAAEEVVAASRDYPVVFTSDGRAQPVALMSLDRTTTPLVTADGRWLGGYLPAHLRRYPFILGDDEEARRFVVMIDRDAPQFSLSPDVGEPLYVNGKAPEGGIIRRANHFLASYQRLLADTLSLTRPLLETGVLVPSSVLRKAGDEEVLAVQGIRVVDPAALEGLPDATLARWLRSGLLSLVVAHRHSLGTVARLEAITRRAASG